MNDEQEKEKAQKGIASGEEVLLRQQTIDLLVANIIPTTKYFESRFDFLQHQINQFGEGQKRLEETMNRRSEQAHTEIKEFKADVDKRFEQVDKRFEQVDKRFEQIIASIDRLADKLDRRDVEQRHFTIRMFTVAISISFLGLLGVLLKIVGVF